MEKKHKYHYNHNLNFIEQMSQELAGYDPDSLQREMEEAQRQWKLQQQEHPEEAEALMQKAARDFEKLMADIHEHEADVEAGLNDRRERCLEGKGDLKDKTAEMQAEEPIAIAAETTYEAVDEGRIGAEAEGAGHTGSRTDGEGYAGSADDGIGAVRANREDAVNAAGTKHAAEAKALSGQEEAVCIVSGEGYTRAAVADQNSIACTLDRTYPEHHRTIAGAETEYGKLIAIRKKTLRRVAILTAAAMILGVGGMASVARQGYRTAEYPEQYGIGQRNVVRSNVKVEFSEGRIEEAYKQIGDAFDIKVLALDYLPENMEFDKFILSDRVGIIKLSAGDKKIYLEQRPLNDINKVSVLLMDRKAENIITNEWIGQELYLEENKLEDGLVEYSIQFDSDSATYYLSGIMDRAEFVEIAENIYFWN